MFNILHKDNCNKQAITKTENSSGTKKFSDFKPIKDFYMKKGLRILKEKVRKQFYSMVSKQINIQYPLD